VTSDIERQLKLIAKTRLQQQVERMTEIKESLDGVLVANSSRSTLQPASK